MPHTHMSKLLHRILPTHASGNKFDAGTRRCVLCGSLDEDYIHILRCEHSHRMDWRTQLLIGLRNFFIQTNTSPLLSALLLDGLRQWFISTTDLHLCPERYHPALRNIIIEQNKIGWIQIFLGRFSTAWSQLQRHFSSCHSSTNDQNPQDSDWQAKLIQLIWAQWYSLWKQWNYEVHGHDERTRAEASKREVRRQLTEITDIAQCTKRRFKSCCIATSTTIANTPSASPRIGYRLTHLSFRKVTAR